MYDCKFVAAGRPVTDLQSTALLCVQVQCAWVQGLIVHSAVAYKSDQWITVFAYHFQASLRLCWLSLTLLLSINNVCRAGSAGSSRHQGKLSGCQSTICCCGSSECVLVGGKTVHTKHRPRWIVRQLLVITERDILLECI